MRSLRSLTRHDKVGFIKDRRISFLVMQGISYADRLTFNTALERCGFVLNFMRRAHTNRNLVILSEVECFCET